MRQTIVISIIFFFLLLPHDQYANPDLDSLLKDIKRYESGLYLPSINTKNTEELIFPRPSDSLYKAQEETYREFLNRLEAISNESLKQNEQIDKSVLMLKLFDELSYYQFKQYFIPFNAEGGFYNQAVFMTRNFKISTLDDGNYYLRWLKGYSGYLENQKEFLKKGIDEKIMAPKVIVQNTIKLIGAFCSDDIYNNPLYAPFSQISESLNDKEIKYLSTASSLLFKDVIIPQYKELRRFMEFDYLPMSYENPGILNIPNGSEYYENRVRHYTTLPLNAEKVHQIGLKEVDRIKSRMVECLNESGFDGTLEEFINYLRTHPRFYAARPDDLLYYAAWLSKKAEGQLPKYFKELSSLPFTVEPVPESIAPTYTSGRYVHGSWKSKSPGIYWVNTYKLDSRPLYNMPALTLHEAVPGHHLQNQFIAEQDNVSNLRRSYYISAFGEGWGLYSEFLGEEMGMYSDAYELFGRLSYEMWRACRLVVDTGIHSKAWSREKAVKFLAENTALSMHEVNTEIDRYIGWPGQALSYKIGELKIKELRDKAERELDNKFDIRDFHYEILKNGSVPLPVLEEVIEEYISSSK